MGQKTNNSMFSWAAAVVLAAGFVMAALGKFMGGATEWFEGWGYPFWFMILIGVLEVAGAAGLLIPKLTRLAVYGLTVIMLGALYTLIRTGDTGEIMRPLVFLILMWMLWWMRRPARHD